MAGVRPVGDAPLAHALEDRVEVAVVDDELREEKKRSMWWIA